MSEHPMPAVHKLTVSELWALYPDETHVRHELIGGEHFVTAHPVTRHQQLVGRLWFEFELYLREHPNTGEAFGVPLDVVLSPYDVVAPDLVLITDDQEEILTPKNVQGAPALVVEVLSPSTRKRDIGIKRQLFDRAGVREYWIVDGKLNRIEVHRRNLAGKLALTVELKAGAGDMLTTPILPGSAFPLERIFAL